MTGVIQGKPGSTWGSPGPEDRDVSASCGQLRPERGADGQPDSRALQRRGGNNGCLRAGGWEGGERSLTYYYIFFCTFYVTFYTFKK